MDVSASAIWSGTRETLQLYFPYMMIAALVFSLGAIVGVGGGLLVGDEYMDEFESGTDGVVGEDTVEEASIAGDSVELTTKSLFVHNTTVALIFIVVGVFSAGIGTMFQLLYNGFVIGAVAGVASMYIGVPATFMLLIPHGVFELPALFLAAAIPLRFWWLVLKQVRADEPDLLDGHGREAARALLLAIALLLIAAVIEAELTVWVAEVTVGIPI